MAAGTSRMWITYRRRMVSAAGKGPPKKRKVIQVPATGMDREME
jgi:hypothetical protein